MCGIIGYVGLQPAAPILLEGLKRLEYRGYDSAGICTQDDENLFLIKGVGRVESLARDVLGGPRNETCGIGHTRWATHGGVSNANSHPHLSNDGKFALIHNGVVENFLALKRFLTERGCLWRSETDTEVLCNFIAYHYARESAAVGSQRLMEAVRQALSGVEGAYGIALLCTDFPGQIVAARRASPLVLGIGRDEYIVASDVAAFVGRTQDVVYLNDGEIALLTRDGFTLRTLDLASIEPVLATIDWTVESVELGHHAHFMLKEIFEQPTSLENTMRGHFAEDGSTAKFGGLNVTAAELRDVDRLLLLGCGTAWHAALVAEHLIERFARVPCEADYSSEFRYRNVPLDAKTLILVISQSGETIDTLAALREAKRKGHRVLAINNVVGSSIAREADGGIFQHVGPEIGVASTKTFTSQLMLGALIALHVGRMRDMSFSDGVIYANALKTAPDLVRRMLAEAGHVQRIARKYSRATGMLFLGRLALFPIALEGALKVKEISYIHADGYPAAEMKHGPIAMVCEDCPSVVFAPAGEMFPKILSSMQEIKARRGPVIAIITEGTELPPGLADETICLPACHEAVLPIVATIPIQLLAYYLAVERACDVDKPRNLAKSVTVE